MRAVERAVDVLRCFAGTTATLSVTDLQSRTRLSRPVLYRLLRTLEAKGLVRSFGEPLRYELGAGVVELAGAWLARRDVVAAAQPYLTALWRETNETVSLFVPTSPAAKLCVHELRSREALVYTRGLGFTEPTTIGASGKVLLANMAIADVESVLRNVPDEDLRAALPAELARIRAQGYCISAGAIIAGAIAIAAPVFERDGTVAASVCLFGPEVRLGEPRRQECLAKVCETAAAVSAALGYRAGMAAE